MKRYWFRRTGTLNWAPSTWEAWAVLGMWIPLGPVLGESLALRAKTQAMLVAGIIWTTVSVGALIWTVVATGEPRNRQ